MSILRILMAGVLGCLIGWLAASTACSRDGLRGDPVTIISGVVTDSATSLYVDSARIYVNDSISYLAFDYTDSVGSYLVDPEGLGWFRVICVKEGYNPESVLIFSLEGKSDFDSVNFRLTPK